jgi:hypothetical protein
MKSTIWKLAALLPLALTLGAGCPLIPDVKDKAVQLAVGGSVTVPFEARGTINTLDETKTIDVAGSIDLAQILDDAGVDVEDVDSVKVAGVSYRVTQPDPTPTKMIENATITIGRGVTADTPLVTSFEQHVNSATSFTAAPLDPAGVNLLNGVLAEILANVKNNASMPISVTYHLVGDVTPGAPSDTDFDWELKMDITILGEVKVSVPS